MEEASQQQLQGAATSDAFAISAETGGAATDVEEVRHVDPEHALEDEPVEDRLRDEVTGESNPVGAARPSEEQSPEETPGASGSAIGPAAPKTSSALTLKSKILQLKDEQRRIRAENKAKSREIRNTERRSKRLKSRVGSLTDEDLNEVLRARAEAKASATVAKSPAKAKKR